MYILKSTNIITLDYTEVFGSNGFGNYGFSGLADLFAIPKLKFCIKIAQKFRTKRPSPTDPALLKTSVHVLMSVVLTSSGKRPSIA